MHSFLWTRDLVDPGPLRGPSVPGWDAGLRPACCRPAAGPNPMAHVGVVEGIRVGRHWVHSSSLPGLPRFEVSDQTCARSAPSICCSFSAVCGAGRSGPSGMPRPAPGLSTVCSRWWMAPPGPRGCGPRSRRSVGCLSPQPQVAEERRCGLDCAGQELVGDQNRSTPEYARVRSSTVSDDRVRISVGVCASCACGAGDQKRIVKRGLALSLVGCGFDNAACYLIMIRLYHRRIGKSIPILGKQGQSRMGGAIAKTSGVSVEHPWQEAHECPRGSHKRALL